MQYNELMKEGHRPENLLAYEETQGASYIINKWVDEGHEVLVITGRPYDSYEPSRQWLDNHGLERIPLFCVDKYGREQFNQGCTYRMTLEQLYSMEFDLAVEDSPAAFEHVMHLNNCKVAVYNRPWNIEAKLPNDGFVSATMLALSGCGIVKNDSATATDASRASESDATNVSYTEKDGKVTYNIRPQDDFYGLFVSRFSGS